MRNFTIYLAVLLCLFANKMLSQTFEEQAEKIGNTIEKITKDEKAALKIKVEEINVALEKNQIKKEDADKKKLDLATVSANNIEKLVGEQQLKLSQLVQDKVNGKVTADNKSKRSISIEFKNAKKDSCTYNGERRTTSQFVFAAGLNNVVTDGSTANSDFKTWGSHFYEFGFTGNYRMLKTNNLLHLKYGLSFMWNNLRPSNNRAFFVNGDSTTLATATEALDESRLRNVYLVFPLHLEFDFSPAKSNNGKSYFKSHESVRIGLGGFVGTNLGTKQYIETKLNGHWTETVTDSDWNTNNFIYGLSTYIGYKSTSLYLKYDLNPLFRNNTIKQNNVSLGVRFDL